MGGTLKEERGGRGKNLGCVTQEITVKKVSKGIDEKGAEWNT